jgi:hypothetical protein
MIDQLNYLNVHVLTWTNLNNISINNAKLFLSGSCTRRIVSLDTTAAFTSELNNRGFL